LNALAHLLLTTFHNYISIDLLMDKGLMTLSAQ